MITANKTFARRRAAGLCIQCGKEPSAKVRCDECNVINNARITKARQARRAAGQCALCMERVTAGRFCHRCRLHINDGARRRYFEKTIAQEGTKR